MTTTTFHDNFNSTSNWVIQGHNCFIGSTFPCFFILWLLFLRSCYLVSPEIFKTFHKFSIGLKSGQIEVASFPTSKSSSSESRSLSEIDDRLLHPAGIVTVDDKFVVKLHLECVGIRYCRINIAITHSYRTPNHVTFNEFVYSCDMIWTNLISFWSLNINLFVRMQVGL